MKSLGRLLEEHPASPDDTVLHTLDHAVTLRELRVAVDVLAAQLHDAGVQAGTPVVVVVDDGIGGLTGVFAAWSLGAVVTPLNARLTAAELQAAYDSTAPAAIVLDDADHASPRVPALVRTGLLTWSDAQGPRVASPARHDGDAALIMRTSGTTGDPKAVVMHHANVLEGIDTMASQLRSKSRAADRPPMPNLIPTPLGLWAGLWNALFGLRVGAPIVLLGRFDPVHFATLVERHGIRSTILPPAMMTMLSSDPRVSSLAPLRSVRSVTAPLTPAQARTFRDRFGIAVLNGYGQTELGGEVIGWVGSDVSEFGESKLGSVGRPHPGIEVSVLDDDHQPVAPGTLGQLWVLSPFAHRTDPEVARRLDAEGRLQTGDLGWVDADGFVWLEGRVSDMLNRGGMKVSPQEVEEALRAQPGIADAVVAGVPDERLGEAPVAWVVPLVGATPDPPALLAALREVLSPYKVPVEVVTLDELPRNEIGKVLRRPLTDSWKERP